MAEMALGHRVGSATELAYRRGDMLEKRKLMMEDWCSFLEGKYHYDKQIKAYWSDEVPKSEG